MHSEAANGPQWEQRQGCKLSAVLFNFSTKETSNLEFENLATAAQKGSFVWIDVEVEDPETARSTLIELGTMEDSWLEEVLSGSPKTEDRRYPDRLHLVLTECIFAHHEMDLRRLDAVISEDRLVTIHRGPIQFLKSLRREYLVDFQKHAETSSFLIYVLWDHLVRGYEQTQQLLGEEVQKLQAQLLAVVDERGFRRISRLNRYLLTLRKILLPVRAVLLELAHHRSTLISEATRPFMAEKASRIELLLEDLIVDRHILTESMNLNVSMVAHRTNQGIKRLTSVSTIFLPLMFLCGVWGMNFAFMPELEWELGYPLFWLAALVLTLVQVIILRRKDFL